MFVLSGGANYGAVQVGMLRALFAAGIQPDAVIGASVGAINAVALASDPTAGGVDRLRELWLGLRREDVFPGSKLGRVWKVARKSVHLHPRPVKVFLRPRTHDLRKPDQLVHCFALVAQRHEQRDDLFVRDRAGEEGLHYRAGFSSCEVLPSLELFDGVVSNHSKVVSALSPHRRSKMNILRAAACVAFSVGFAYTASFRTRTNFTL